MSSNLFSEVIMLSSLISRMLNYIFLLLRIIVILYIFWCNVPNQWKVLPFGLVTAPRIFTALAKPILFLCHCKSFHIVIFLDDILVLVYSKQAGKRAHSFLYSLLVSLGLHINFFKSDLCLTQDFLFFWGYVGILSISLVSLPPDKLADIQQLALPLMHTQLVTVHWIMSFLGKANFMPMATPNCRKCVMSFRVTCWLFITLLPTCFLLSPFPFQFYINWNSYLICNRVQFLCNFHFMMWLLLQMPCPLIGPFIFRVLVCPCQLMHPGLVLCVWLILPCKSFRLCKMAFHLSGKVVALHVDNSIAKAYLCNQGGTLSPFLSRLAFWILSLTDMHSITLYFSIHSYPS